MKNNIIYYINYKTELENVLAGDTSYGTTIHLLLTNIIMGRYL
jgi:hypothetical protein